MSLHVIPLIQEFYLATDRIEIPENKIIPTSAGKNGKIESGYVLQKSHPYYEIDTLYWRTTPLVNRIFIIHFQEILLAFIHSQLMSQKNYAIFNYERANGIKLYLHPKKPTNICIEVFDRKAKNFILAETLCKVECRILVRQLHYYLHSGTIVEEALNESVECFYSEKSFKLKTPKVYE